jgi:hypothetical protein
MIDQLKLKDYVVNESKNLCETGKKFGCTREYVRQVLRKFGINIKELKSKNPEAFCRREKFNHKCVNCGEKFISYNRNAKTCSRKCLCEWFNKINVRPCTWADKVSKAQKENWAGNTRRKQDLSKRMKTYWKKQWKEEAELRA